MVKKTQSCLPAFGQRMVCEVTLVGWHRGRLGVNKTWWCVKSQFIECIVTNLKGELRQGCCAMGLQRKSFLGRPLFWPQKDCSGKPGGGAGFTELCWPAPTGAQKFKKRKGLLKLDGIKKMQTNKLIPASKLVIELFQLLYLFQIAQFFVRKNKVIKAAFHYFHIAAGQIVFRFGLEVELF